jgi:hypothetical protein
MPVDTPCFREHFLRQEVVHIDVKVEGCINLRLAEEMEDFS